MESKVASLLQGNDVGYRSGSDEVDLPLQACHVPMISQELLLFHVIELRA